VHPVRRSERCDPAGPDQPPTVLSATHHDHADVVVHQVRQEAREVETTRRRTGAGRRTGRHDRDEVGDRPPLDAARVAEGDDVLPDHLQGAGPGDAVDAAQRDLVADAGSEDPGQCGGLDESVTQQSLPAAGRHGVLHHLLREEPVGVVAVRSGAAAIAREVHGYTLPRMNGGDTSGARSTASPATPLSEPAADDAPSMIGLVAADEQPVGRRTLVRVPGNHLMTDLLGPRDELLDVVEDAFPSTAITVRGNEISVAGPDAARVGRLFEELVVVLERGLPLERASVQRTVEMIRADERPSEVLSTEVLRTSRGGRVRPKTSGQKRYVDTIAANTVTFGIGPAGTGKSWLAVAMAVRALQRKEVERIVLTRPAVEAGERLGFLPGDLMAKVDPYLRPLYDALHDMVGPEGAQRLLERGTVEVAPLAFMRGRTLNASFIILDEAQNTTSEQMKMFLTRIGFGSKAVITGDITQVDVPGGRSGLDGLESILGEIEGLAFVRLSGTDVVRHRIVQDIVNAYERRAAEDPGRT
jgi:phosphate starvation-inducible protein PhoH and related proteins